MALNGALNEDERRGFVEKAKVDKERFEEEMIQFDADAAVEVARGLELEEQVEGGVEVEGGEEGAVELEEEGGVSSKVKLVVMFKEDRNIISKPAMHTVLRSVIDDQVVK